MKKTRKERAAAGGDAADATEQTSLNYIGRWNRLVSTTNWEKGRIILEWRTTLEAAGAAATEYSDETWSRRVGQVSAQHVGRLRRVHERFGAVRDDYAGLYWSHFQAALDWDDAEMWLEGAVQEGWSISDMRSRRWEALGAPADKKPRDEDVITSEWDEDFLPPDADLDEVRDVGEEPDATRPREARSSSAGEIDDASRDAESPFFEDEQIEAPALASAAPFRPFAELPDLPDDVHDAFESFKLAIVRHKLAGWKEIALGDLVGVLEALKQLALAPADGD